MSSMAPSVLSCSRDIAGREAERFLTELALKISEKEWATDGALYPGGGRVFHIMTYMRRLRAKGVPFLGYRYTK